MLHFTDFVLADSSNFCPSGHLAEVEAAGLLEGEGRPQILRSHLVGEAAETKTVLSVPVLDCLRGEGGEGVQGAAARQQPGPQLGAGVVIQNLLRNI